MQGRLGIVAAPMQVSGRGTVTAVRHDGLLYVLFHDDGEGSCAQIWVVLGDGEAQATASNNSLRFGTDTWIITGTSVVRLWHNGTYSDGPGTDLARALTRQGPARSPQVPLVDDATGQGEWLPDPSSGYLRRMVDGTYSGSSCLVDPTWRRRRQLEHFDSLDLSWLPLTQLETERRRISGGAPTCSEPMPGSNVTYLPFWPRVEHWVVPYPPDDERPHDAGLSWPVLHPNGSVALAAGERVVESFTTSRPRVSDVRDGEVSLGSVIMRDGHDQIGATLTPERLVLVAMPKVVEVDSFSGPLQL